MNGRDRQYYEKKLIELDKRSARAQKLMSYGSAVLFGAGGIRVYDSIVDGRIKDAVVYSVLTFMSLITSYVMYRRARDSEQRAKDRQKLSELEKE